jgi:hypothetical protein
MQVVDDGGYIDIEPVGGLMYVPVYDPYIVFARPRSGFFVGGAIRFGGGFHWVSGYNRFNWRSHEVVVNRRVWTPPVRRTFVQPAPRFEDRGRNFTGGNHEWNRPQPMQRPAAQPPAQRSFVPQQPRRDNGQRNFVAPQQRSFTAPRQMEQHNAAPQPRNMGERSQRGAEGRGRGR